MKRIVNSIISVILAISMVLCTNLINVNAQERSTQLSKGQYLIINSKKNKLGYFKEGILVKEFLLQQANHRHQHHKVSLK